jgi:hypothetical protein
MTKGVLIFAHNSREVDYSALALISGGLAKKHLKVPVSVVTDKYTLEWAKQSNIYDQWVETFDQIIEVEKPTAMNNRKLHDGIDYQAVPFINSNRTSAWELTPYDITLLIDCDFLIFSDRLNQYWELEESVLISPAMNDIYDEKRVGYHDRYVSDTGPNLYWATTVMFKKNQESKLFFDMVEYVKENYQYYSELFGFLPWQYRNDISFSVAKHMLAGFETDKKFNLPPVLTVQDRDILYDISENGKLIFLITPTLDKNYCLASVEGLDVHVMNKQSIVRNQEKLMKLI